jgi:hypothetical protein
LSYNGSGTFVLNTTGLPYVTGTVISSTAGNALNNDLATGLTTAITKDGQTTPTANIPLGNFKITNLGAGTVASDAARLSQVQNSGVTTLIAITGTDTITGTVSPTLTAYTAGQIFSFVVAATNTGAVTLNINSLGAQAITRTGAVALVAGDLVTAQVALVEYDGTRFQLLNGNSFTNLKASGTLGVTGATTLSSTLAVTGITTVAAGSQGLPAIVSTTGTADTGQWFPAADTIAFSTAGTERVRITSTGPLEIKSTNQTGFIGAAIQNNNSNIGIAGTQFSSDATYYKAAIGLLRGNVNGGGSIVFYNDSNSDAADWATTDEKMRIDLNGNVGIGNTSPSSLDSNAYNLVIGSGSGAKGLTIYTGTSSLGSINFADGTSGADAYRGIVRYQHSDNSMLFFTDATERMRITSGGNVGIACTPSRRLSVQYDFAKTDTTSREIAVFKSNDASNANEMLISSIGAATQASRVWKIQTGEDGVSNAGALSLQPSGGFVAIGTATGGPSKLEVVTSTDISVIAARSPASYTNPVYFATSVTAASTAWYYFYGTSSTNTVVNIAIFGNGNVQNTNNSYGAISDIKLKENIIDATPKLEQLNRVRVVNFNLKSSPEQKQLGVIAQELESIFPGMVDEINDRDADNNLLETKTKSVKYSVFVPMLIKAMQEQQAIIETLTARITALETE